MLSVKEVMSERGFTGIVGFSSDHRCYFYINPSNNICCKVYMDKEEFELFYYIEGLLTVTTGKCGSLRDDKHFNFFLEKMESAVNRLQGW